MFYVINGFFKICRKEIKMSLKEKFEKLAEEHHLELTDKADKILRIKERQIDEYQCPCFPESPTRFCISPWCLEEAHEKGHCHCNLFKRKD